MMKNRLSNKAMSLSIVLLVLLSVLLTTTALFYFIISENKLNNEFYGTSSVKDISLRENLINYNIAQMVSYSSRNINSKGEFINNFNSLAEKYKKIGGFYVSKEDKERWPFLEDKNTESIAKLQEQLSEDDIELIQDEKGNIEGVKVTFYIVIENRLDEPLGDNTGRKRNIFSVSREYAKSFISET